MMRTGCGGGDRGVAPFYRVREAVEGSGGGLPVRWVLIPIVFEGVKGEEETGRCHFNGGVKAAWRRVAVSGAGQRRRWLRRREVDDSRSWVELLGRKAVQAGRPAGPVQGFWVGRGRRQWWAEMGQKARWTGRYGGLDDEKIRKRERLTGGLPRIPGRTDFWPRGRIEKGFRF
jgi:hypothetical protein